MNVREQLDITRQSCEFFPPPPLEKFNFVSDFKPAVLFYKHSFFPLWNLLGGFVVPFKYKSALRSL